MLISGRGSSLSPECQACTWSGLLAISPKGPEGPQTVYSLPNLSPPTTSFCVNRFTIHSEARLFNKWSLSVQYVQPVGLVRDTDTKQVNTKYKSTGKTKKKVSEKTQRGVLPERPLWRNNIPENWRMRGSLWLKRTFLAEKTVQAKKLREERTWQTRPEENLGNYIKEKRGWVQWEMKVEKWPGLCSFCYKSWIVF